ncbi:MAG TPA: GNAT family N-acetyltransferase [Polyangiaceae bacterium]|nr:GNAT family N-acetyltransferase [Polyangiaceae bacterium]
MPAHPLERYRAWLEDSLSPRVRAWCPDAAGRRCEEASAQYLQRTLDEEYARRYARACPVVGVDHRQYQLRELTLTSGARLLVGIHFRGQATSYPFVGVFAQSRWLTSEEMAAAHTALMREFRVFSPRASRWWAPTEEHVPQLATAQADLLLVMGSLAEIRGQPAGALPREWRLRQVSSVNEVSTAFVDLYQRFHEARPELAEAVPASPLDALEDCAKDEGLYVCSAGAEIVGIVAAKPVAQYSVDAWLMWDIVLARRYCSQGLAPLLQRAVLDRLDGARAALVVGTIDARNLPSLRTALRVGRHVVGTWTFLTRAG